MTVYCVMRGTRLHDVWATRDLAERDSARFNAMFPRGTQTSVVAMIVRDEKDAAERGN